MGKVKSALEIALERAGKIGALTKEEKERMADEEKVTDVLKEFYREKLDANGLWQSLKGSPLSLLRTAQTSLVDTLTLGTIDDEFRRRSQAVVAVETLKDRPNTAGIEGILNSLEDLRKEYVSMKERVLEDLRKQIEEHPQLRMKPVKTPDGKTVMQMAVSVDEAVKTRLAEYLAEHEEEYSQEFAALIEELKAEIS